MNNVNIIVFGVWILLCLLIIAFKLGYVLGKRDGEENRQTNKSQE